MATAHHKRITSSLRGRCLACLWQRAFKLAVFQVDGRSLSWVESTLIDLLCSNPSRCLARRYHLAENDYRWDVVQIYFLELSKAVTTVILCGSTVMEIIHLRCLLCTITDIAFSWNRQRREMSFFFHHSTDYNTEHHSTAHHSTAHGMT